MFLSILLFINVAHFVSSQGIWSTWGPWSACDGFGRQTRVRKCLNSCPDGLSKRSRQCGPCLSPLLKQMEDSSIEFTVTSSSLHARKTAWCTGKLTPDVDPFVEISFKNFVQLSGIGTWGHADGYINKYKIKFSYDGKVWFPYSNRAGEDEFPGNSDTVILRNNTFKSPLVARVLRVYPTSYTTQACFKLELYGCSFNCGGLITRDATVIRSPSAMNEEELKCLWRIEPEFATKLLLKFSYLKLFCNNGILKLHDGRFTPSNDQNLVEAFCGHAGEVTSQLFHGKALWMQYISNATSPNTGFNIQLNDFVLKTLNKTSAEIHVPEIGFSNIYRYVWMIQAPRTNDTIQLTLKDFISNNTRIHAAKCVADMITIHHSNQGKTHVEKYCGTKYPRVFNSTNGFLKIKYKSRTANPKWKIRFSYKILGYSLTTPTTARRDVITSYHKTPTTRTAQMPSNEVNNTILESARKKESSEGSSNVPIIVSCVLAVLIIIVCLVALVHYLKRRKEYLKNHPYDCNRPMSHFGEEDATPFINSNLLMWTDSTKSKSSEKSRKSFPLVEVTLSESEPQRLSIIAQESLKSSSAISFEAPENETTGSLKVSDNFTEECMKLLNNNLSSQGDNDKYTPDG